MTGEKRAKRQEGMTWLERMKEETFTMDNVYHIGLGAAVVALLMLLQEVDPKYVLLDAGGIVLWLRESTQWQVHNTSSRFTFKSLYQGGEMHHIMEWAVPSAVLQIVGRFLGFAGVI